MSTEQAGVVPSCSVYTQHGRLVMSHARQWRHGQKRCPEDTHKGCEHGPEDKTLWQSVHSSKHPTMSKSYITSRWKGKALTDLWVQEETAQGMLYPQNLGKQPQVTSVERAGSRDSAMKSVRWSPIFHLIFLFSFRFLHRKTLAPDCH